MRGYTALRDAAGNAPGGSYRLSYDWTAISTNGYCHPVVIKYNGYMGICTLVILPYRRMQLAMLGDWSRKVAGKYGYQ